MARCSERAFLVAGANGGLGSSDTPSRCRRPSEEGWGAFSPRCRQFDVELYRDEAGSAQACSEHLGCAANLTRCEEPTRLRRVCFGTTGPERNDDDEKHWSPPHFSRVRPSPTGRHRPPRNTKIRPRKARHGRQQPLSQRLKPSLRTRQARPCSSRLPARRPMFRRKWAPRWTVQATSGRRQTSSSQACAVSYWR
jgi:hypothetical protein